MSDRPWSAKRLRQSAEDAGTNVGGDQISQIIHNNIGQTQSLSMSIEAYRELLKDGIRTETAKYLRGLEEAEAEYDELDALVQDQSAKIALLEAEVRRKWPPAMRVVKYGGAGIATGVLVTLLILFAGRDGKSAAETTSVASDSSAGLTSLAPDYTVMTCKDGTFISRLAVISAKNYRDAQAYFLERDISYRARTKHLNGPIRVARWENSCVPARSDIDSADSVIIYTGPFPSKPAAEAACRQLEFTSWDCLALQSS